MCRFRAVFSVITTLYFSPQLVSAQEISAGDTLRLTREKGEVILLQSSLLAMAERLEIDQAKALKWQAEIWANPRLEVDEVNLWATPRQLANSGESLPPIWGNFGRNQQISASLEQQILTAGKRKKLVALEEVKVEQAEMYFKDFVRGLKSSFRTLVADAQFLLQSQLYHRDQLETLTTLERALQRQVELGNTGKADWIRLKAAQFELKRELLEIEKKQLEINQETILLMGLPEQIFLVWEAESLNKKINLAGTLSLGRVLELAQSERPDLQLARLETRYFSQLQSYETAQRVPDLNLKIGYDRGGNFISDFVGIGFSTDLPVFNRNQGNIKAAKIQKEQADLLQSYKSNEVQKDITSSYLKLLKEIDFFKEIEPGYEQELDQLLESYTQNFAQRNISLMVYLDFLEAYMENKSTLLHSLKNIQENFEELQYLVGRDFDSLTTL